MRKLAFATTMEGVGLRKWRRGEEVGSSSKAVGGYTPKRSSHTGVVVGRRLGAAQRWSRGTPLGGRAARVPPLGGGERVLEWRSRRRVQRR